MRFRSRMVLIVVGAMLVGEGSLAASPSSSEPDPTSSVPTAAKASGSQSDPIGRGACRCSSGDLTVELIGIRTGLSPRDLRSAARRGEKPWVRADFRIAQGGQRSRAWLPQTVILSDAEGNSWREQGNRVFFSADGLGCFAFAQPAERHPGPWKLNVEMARGTRFMPYELWSNYTKAELWTVPTIEVPDAREFLPSHIPGAKAQRQGAELQLLGAAGYQAELPGSSKSKVPRRVRLQVGVAGDDPDTHVTLVRATDFHGRLAPLKSVAARRHDGVRLLTFEVQTQPDARTLNVTFAVHRSRTLEFTTNPVRSELGLR